MIPQSAPRAPGCNSSPFFLPPLMPESVPLSLKEERERVERYQRGIISFIRDSSIRILPHYVGKSEKITFRFFSEYQASDTGMLLGSIDLSPVVAFKKSKTRKAEIYSLTTNNMIDYVLNCLNFLPSTKILYRFKEVQKSQEYAQVKEALLDEVPEKEKEKLSKLVTKDVVKAIQNESYTFKLVPFGDLKLFRRKSKNNSTLLKIGTFKTRWKVSKLVNEKEIVWVKRECLLNVMDFYVQNLMKGDKRNVHALVERAKIAPTAELARKILFEPTWGGYGVYLDYVDSSPQNPSK